MKRGERKRGFNQFRKQVRDKAHMSRNVANCKSCKFFNSDEECTNPNVTEFDMVKEESRTYCTFWKGFEYDNGRSK
jgi:hypothetical protein